jgi:DNA-binding SARP family transcriptional activator
VTSAPSAIETVDAVLAGERTPAVSVACFGTFSLVIGNARVDAWRGRKSLALFQYLIAHRDRPISRDVLIQALWPDPEAAAAGTSLKVAVHALRQTLKPHTGELIVLTHDAGYELYAPEASVDADTFDRLCRRSHRLECAGQAAEALLLYAQAVDLYRGDFLADSTEDWVMFRREGLKDEYLHALARLADGALAAGDLNECMHRCRQILEQDHCREDAFRLLMLCHVRLGQPGRARDWYELCVRTLHRELGVGPDENTVRLYQEAIGSPA